MLLAVANKVVSGHKIDDRNLIVIVIVIVIEIAVEACK